MLLLLPVLLLRRNTCDDDDDSDDAMLVPRHNPTTKSRLGSSAHTPSAQANCPVSIHAGHNLQIRKGARRHHLSNREPTQRSNHPKMRAPAATTDARDSPHGGPPIYLSPSLSLSVHFTDTQKPRTQASQNPRAQCRSTYERRPARKARARPPMFWNVTQCRRTESSKWQVMVTSDDEAVMTTSLRTLRSCLFRWHLRSRLMRERPQPSPRPPPLLLSMPRQPPQLIATSGRGPDAGTWDLASRDTRQSRHGVPHSELPDIGRGIGGYRERCGKSGRVSGEVWKVSI